MPYVPKTRPTQDSPPPNTPAQPDPVRDNARFIDSTQTGRFHPVDPDLQFDPEDIAAASALEGFGPPTAATLQTPPWQCIAGAGNSFVAALVAPPSTFVGHLGARIEAPGTRAIVSAWRQASLSGELYTVTLDSPLVAGSYEVVWRTDDPEPPSFESFIPLIAVRLGPGSDSSTWPAIDPDAIRPSLEEIASLEATRARIQDTGEPADTFNDLTRPTAAEVEALIDDAINDVLASLPDVIDPLFWPRVKTAVKYLTAILIEQSFFRNSQAGPSSGAVLTYQTRLQAVLAALSTTNTATAQRLV